MMMMQVVPVESRHEHALAFDTLPVELIADILGNLDLRTLVAVAGTSHRLRAIAADPAINPWRRPLLRNLRRAGAHDGGGPYESCLRFLCEIAAVPRHNWINILSLARAKFVLFEAERPTLPDSYYEESFKRRFLPGWSKWRRGGSSWKAVFLKTLYRVWHRTTTSCTADEAWTKYIVLNRNGSANLVESSSRSFNALRVFEAIKTENNLAHFETRIRLVVEFADVRILALGILGKPTSSFWINDNARVLLQPPGICIVEDEDEDEAEVGQRSTGISSSSSKDPSLLGAEYAYERLVHPTPHVSHRKYPYYTPGGRDRRWAEEGGAQWIGPMMLTAQLATLDTHQCDHYASLVWADLYAIAPWMQQRLTRTTDGYGLGILL